ncbi:MAG TPA: Glu/Leu/Phe/Val dehydrogenase dimerization domain-containing protein [Polyangiaceae bacterium]|nr:Glu/Leu/Phe/Val dehydrogenase dimerization domain-containing protein [Polyangiaceae bacterium]
MDEVVPTAPDAISPAIFTERLLRSGRRRAAFVYDEITGQLGASHPSLADLASAITVNARDFSKHEAIFLEVGKTTGALFGAFLHCTKRGQGAGGVRHWPYDTLHDFLADGLRLSRGMGRKNALAGLWWGGGKGVIARQPGDQYRDPEYRRRLYAEYGQFVSGLRGIYVTAEDVGTSPLDMAEIFTTTRFVTCVPPAVGGSGNPSISTARGVVCAMEGALDFLGRGTLQGKRIAMQGTGNVGNAMIGFLLERGVARIVASEISSPLREHVLQTHRDARLEVRLVTTDDNSIFREESDIFAPNALGGILGPKTIPLLKAPLVCGAANNQLLDEHRDDLALQDCGIAYVPDFLANRMGIVNCANEQYGNLPNDPAITRHFSRDWESSVFNVTRDVLRRALEESTTPARAANKLADELMQQPHPVWGHRNKDIVQALLKEQWADQ